MSSNEAMSKALTCKGCQRYRYACKCSKFESTSPEALEFFEALDEEKTDERT